MFDHGFPVTNVHKQSQSINIDNHNIGVAAATRAARKAGADAQDAVTSLLMLRELPYAEVNMQSHINAVA